MALLDLTPKIVPPCQKKTGLHVQADQVDLLSHGEVEGIVRGLPALLTQEALGTYKCISCQAPRVHRQE